MTRWRRGATDFVTDIRVLYTSYRNIRLGAASLCTLEVATRRVLQWLDDYTNRQRMHEGSGACGIGVVQKVAGSCPLNDRGDLDGGQIPHCAFVVKPRTSAPECPALASSPQHRGRLRLTLRMTTEELSPHGSPSWSKPPCATYPVTGWETERGRMRGAFTAVLQCAQPQSCR